MNRILATVFVLFFSSVVISDANVGTNNLDNTFLLKAPGTLSGTRKPEQAINRQSMNPQTLSQPAAPQLPGSLPKPPPREQQPRYNFVEESSKFRQFGQHSGRNNPWYEEQSSRNPRRPPPMQTPYMTNPWQIGGTPPPVWNQGPSSANDPYLANSRGMYGADSGFSGNRLYPDFPDGIYRDSNPAAYSLPMNNKFMPGFGGGNSGFPFSPFDMF